MLVAITPLNTILTECRTVRRTLGIIFLSWLSNPMFNFSGALMSSFQTSIRSSIMQTIESPHGNSDFIFPVLDRGSKNSSRDKIRSLGKNLHFGSIKWAI
ncbi:hypothetical protein DERF_003476 [Dermatophagoides farinae]|uniref:Uncharacterized protein n=1 Tax=Dermatophagoides farinae TaxID=6954 RepID=A0A922LBI8_DERFA|nr:hypothetical protein DERF_003476 [Dermatophagoides farinae]